MSEDDVQQNFCRYADGIWHEIEACAGGELDVDAVHDIRVGSKRLRACWLLRYEHDGEQRSQSEERRLREISKQLSSQRDNDVALDTCKRLIKHSEDGGQREALGQLRLLLKQRASTRIASTQVDVEEALKRARLVWRQGADDCSSEGLRRGLLRIYKRARRWRQRAANAEERADLQHRWRRWVKHLAFAATALGLLEEERADLVKLGSLLGKRNDLVVLRSLLGEGLAEDERSLVLDAIAAEDERLRLRCRALGEACFQRKRREMAAALGL